MSKPCLHCAISQHIIRHNLDQKNVTEDGIVVVNMEEALSSLAEVVGDFINMIEDPSIRIVAINEFQRAFAMAISTNKQTQPARAPETHAQKMN